MSELKTYDKYITVIEGMDYRTISKELEAIDVFLKHATIRNITERTMPEFLEELLSELNIDESRVNKEDILKTVSFYDNLIEIMGKVINENPQLVYDTIDEIKTQQENKKNTSKEENK